MLMMLLVAASAMLRYPDIPFSRLLRRWLVEAPAARLARIHPAQVIFLVIVAAVLVAGGEMILLMGGAEAALALSWQLSLYLDAGIAVAAAGALARLRPLLLVAVHRVRRRPQAPRRRRTRVAATASPPANDDDRPALAA